MTSGLTPRMADPSASYVVFVLSLTPDHVLRYQNGGGATPESREEWRYVQCAQRLAWEHGAERAGVILSGRDAASNADLAAWRALGAPKAERGSRP